MNVIRPATRLNQTTMRRAGQGDIAAALGGEILSGARKPGERMPSDADMLKTFGVSRVVTREVIKTLAAKCERFDVVSTPDRPSDSDATS